jgi:hypothetical protein
MITTDQKGNIAETAVAASATKLGVDVYRPIGEGTRYDMIFDMDRVCFASNASGQHGMGMCSLCGACYFLPAALWAGRRQLHLRLGPARNNQAKRINWAGDYEFAATLPRLPGAVAQLGERLAGSQ